MPLFYFIWKHAVHDSANQEFSVFCDMDSEPGFTWTLAQSFSLENTDIFRGKRFGINLPLNFDSRSSMSVELAALAVESIGRCIECRCYRCNLWLTTLHNCKKPVTFPPTALKNITRVPSWKITTFSVIFVSVSSLWVHKHQMRGISCENCTAATKQGNLSSWTINSYKSKTEFGFDLDGSPSVNGNENNFGKYRLNTTNSAHHCSSSSASTTQHWLGSVYNL